MLLRRSPGYKASRIPLAQGSDDPIIYWVGFAIENVCLASPPRPMTEAPGTLDWSALGCLSVDYAPQLKLPVSQDKCERAYL